MAAGAKFSSNDELKYANEIGWSGDGNVGWSAILHVPTITGCAVAQHCCKGD